VKLRIFIAIAAAIVLASCATTRFEPGPHLTQVQASELPPPDGVDPATGHRPYRIGPLDRLSINVFGVPDLTQTIQTDAGGAISLPLIGQIQASGKTTDQLAREIEGSLRGRYVRDPHVSVNLYETVANLLTVEGEVREPGQYPVLGGMTLMRAIASAKGPTEFARMQEVVVFRTVGGRQMAALYNLTAIRRGLYPDPAVYTDDVIVVGNSPARRLFRDLLTAAPLLTTPIIALLNNNP